MPFWGNKRFVSRLEEVVPGGDPIRVQQGAYELSLGAEVYVSGEKKKESLETGDIVTIESGATALLLTKETVRIPNGAIGFISVRSRTKAKGLMNISGFHVDPGFEGKLVFTVYNASPEAIVLSCGDQHFKLWLADMDDLAAEQLHQGRQRCIPADSVEQLRSTPVSAIELKKEIEKLHGQRSLIVGALAAVVVALLALIGEGFPWGKLGTAIGDKIFGPSSSGDASNSGASSGSNAPPSPGAQPGPTAPTSMLNP